MQKATFSKGHQCGCVWWYCKCMSVCLSSAKQTTVFKSEGRLDWSADLNISFYLLPRYRRLYVSLLTLACTTSDLPGNSKQGPLSLKTYNKVEDISPQHKLQLGKHLPVKLRSLLLPFKTGQCPLAGRQALLNKLAVTTASLALIETPWGTRRKLSTWCGWFLLTIFSDLRGCAQET